MTTLAAYAPRNDGAARGGLYCSAMPEVLITVVSFS
jgi:hypothetical protein